MSLADLLVEEKTVEIDYPEMDGFVVHVAYLGKDALNKLRTKSTVTKIQKKTRQAIDEIDSELFTKLYIDAVIKGWTGCKYKYLEQLMPIDVSSNDPEDELAYTPEDAALLVKHSTDFDTWIAEMVGDLQNFTKPK